MVKVGGFVVNVAGFIIEYDGDNENIILPNSSEIIGLNDELFFKNTKIKSVFIPKNIKIIGDMAFAYCSNLEHVIFEKKSNISYIGPEAFMKTAIKELEIDSIASVLDIGNGAFNDCSLLETVDLKETKANLQDCCFIKNSNLKKFLGKNVFSVSKYCFSHCTKLAIIDFSSVKDIGDSAFFRCLSLKNININSFCTKVHKLAFDKSPVSEKQINKLFNNFIFTEKVT